jgi:hypothetical protein
MKRLSVYMLLPLLAAVGLTTTGCGWDNFDTVPDQTTRVALERPYDFWHRKEGGRVVVLTTGKRNHGNGPALVYDFDTTIKSAKLQLEVMMQERINQPFVVRVSWQLLPDRVLDAALNFMPDLTQNKINTGNSIQEWSVDVGVIFNTNALPFVDMAARDVIDDQSSHDIDPAALGVAIKQRITDILQGNADLGLPGVLKPRIVLGPDERPLAKDGQMIGILDVLEIKSVTVTYTNPDVIDTQINKIAQLKGQRQERVERLRQMETRAGMAAKDAEHTKTISDNIRDALSANPYMFRKKLLAILKRGVDAGDLSNTKVLFYPASGLDRQFQVQLGAPGAGAIQVPSAQ